MALFCLRNVTSILCVVFDRSGEKKQGSNFNIEHCRGVVEPTLFVTKHSTKKGSIQKLVLAEVFFK
jgi:hypothetical protein